jgi:hypothetical protein
LWWCHMSLVQAVFFLITTLYFKKFFWWWCNRKEGGYNFSFLGCFVDNNRLVRVKNHAHHLSSWVVSYFRHWFGFVLHCT